MKRRVLICMIWLLLCTYLLVTVARGEYLVSYDVLSGASEYGSRHDSLLDTALLVNSHTEHSGEDVFPSLNFLCSGVIHKLFLLGRSRAGGGEEASTFTLRQQGEVQLNFSLVDLREVLHNSETGITLYEHTIEREFFSGDIFGFTQPNTSLSSVVLQYHQFRSGFIFPLVAIETSNPECSTGFLSREALERAVNNHLAISDSLQSTNPGLELHLFPDMRFTCSVNITRLIVGAEEISTAGLPPELQIWRLQEGTSDMYFQVDSVPLSLNVMQEVSLKPGVYNLEVSLSFTRGDILGVFYPQQSNVLLHSVADHGSTLHNKSVELKQPPPVSFQLDNTTLANTRQWPLVAVDADDSSCIQGFISHNVLTLLLQKRELTHIMTDTISFFVVPELVFTTSGLLQKWIFVAEERSNFATDYPHFQVRRRTDQGGFAAVNGTDTSGKVPVRSGSLNVYEYTLDPPALVESGDFVGWSQPAMNKARLLLLVLKNTGYDIHFVTENSANVIGETQILDRYNPLIGVQMLVTPTTVITTPTALSTVITTPTDLPTVVITPTVHDENTSSGIQQLLGTAIGSGLMGIIIILGLCIMLFFVLWAIQKHRKKQEKKSASATEVTERDLSNPLYAQKELTNDHLYQELQKSTGKSTTVPHAQIIQEQGSVEYDEPIVTTRKLAPPPPVFLKPSKNSQPPLSPPTSPHYHTLDPHNVSPLLLPRDSPRNSPQFPAAPAAHLSPLSPFSDAPLSTLGQRSLQSSIPINPFASLDRRRILHSREHSNTSEYDVIENTSRTMSEGSSHVGGHSRTTSQATTCDDEPIDHVYQELTSEGGYSRLYRGGIWVPTEEQRRRAATTACRQKINIYAALSECSESPKDMEVVFFEESDAYWRPAQDCTGLYAQLARRKYREIMKHQIKVQHPLGSGNFGEVNKGEWQSDQGPVEVAVKTLKRGSSEEDTVKFLQEAAIMGQFRHPNIVALLGIVTLREPVMIVLELLSLGDLRNHLLSLRPLTPGDAVPEETPSMLLGFCKDIASGMEYLERKMFVHRDLASRNILVADDNTCKIGDFGMARDLEDESYYISRGGKIPIRWSPPEALNYKKYTTASDVWSYGVVMYEIWSLGHKPYEGYTNPQTLSLVERGDRLAPPPGCPRPIYTLMINCWHPLHSSRPTFLSLLKALSGGRGELLVWSERDAGSVLAQAMALGAPLEAGRNLYLELQHTYTS